MQQKVEETQKEKEELVKKLAVLQQEKEQLEAEQESLKKECEQEKESCVQLRRENQVSWKEPNFSPDRKRNLLLSVMQKVLIVFELEVHIKQYQSYL